jgi:hemolysin activation/secretion protein
MGSVRQAWVFLFVVLAATRCWAQATSRPILPPVQTAQPGQLSEVGSVQVETLRFEGNTVFTDKQLNEVAQPILDRHPDRMLSIEDLQAIRTALTTFYINAGFINSGALLPDQQISNGTVTFKIIEGKLTAIHVMRRSAAGGGQGQPMAATAPPPPPANGQAAAGAHPNEATPPAIPSGSAEQGLHLLRDSYVADRIYLVAGPPLNITKLKERLEILRQDPNLQAVNAILKPGDYPGQSILNLFITERNPVHLGMEYSNPRSPAVGAYRFDVLASDTDLTGSGDALSLRYGVLDGSFNDMRFAQANDLTVDYSLPFTPYDTTLLVDYTRSSDLVVEPPFAQANITSRTDELSLTVRQPIWRTPTHQLALFGGASSEENTTFVMGQPFSFSPGADNGTSNVFALRLGGDFTSQGLNDALALRSTFGIGLDFPDATINSNGQPDTRFFDWLGQAQYVHTLPLGPVDSSLYGTKGVLRFNAQLSAEPLLAPEQFGLGGIETVRGYRENQIVRDNGLDVQAELHIPLAQKSGRDWLDVRPFVDAGYGWNVKDSSPELLSSIGIGLVFAPTEKINFQIYYGYAFKKFDNPTTDLQDMGIHFSLTVFAF